jgi:subtilisin family serine protease
VTVAIVDTGLWTDKGLRQGSRGNPRILAQYDALTDTDITTSHQSTGNDGNGHGSHVAAVAASSRKVKSEYNGIAPEADLVIVKAFAADGQSTYADVLRGLD